MVQDGADLTGDDRALLALAQGAARHAYAPYSGFAVGAAVRSRSGRVYLGANMENASYGLTTCAEQAALANAVVHGDFIVQSIAIAGAAAGPGPPEAGGPAVTPCGRCRQLITEAARVAATDIRVVCASGDLSGAFATTIRVLLPHAFGPDDLGVDGTRWR